MYYIIIVEIKNVNFMNSRKFCCVLGIACLLFCLNACSSRGDGSNENQVATVDNSNTSLDWQGTYSGVLPCADCEGIETKLSLNEDNTYEITWKYEGRNNEEYVCKGTFTWNSDGSMITLENLDTDKYPTMYKVGENHLLQLDLKGNVISGENADNYRLNKE